MAPTRRIELPSKLIDNQPPSPAGSVSNFKVKWTIVRASGIPLVAGRAIRLLGERLALPAGINFPTKLPGAAFLFAATAHISAITPVGRVEVARNGARVRHDLINIPGLDYPVNFYLVRVLIIRSMNGSKLSFSGSRGTALASVFSQTSS